MTLWVCSAIVAILAACSTRTVGERERALERIPAQTQVILAADGNALATPVFRRVIESLAPHIPPNVSCVVDAATTSEAVVAGFQQDVGVTIVLVTRAVVDRCPLLSKIAEHTYVATIGAGAPAAGRGSSVMGDATWARARPYLLREPVAIAAELPDLRLVAVAQPEPLDAWLAIDAVDSGAVERSIKNVLAQWQVPATIELAGKLEVARAGTQVSVHAKGLTEPDLITIATGLVRALDAPSVAPPPSVTFTCPSQPGNGIVSCHDGTHYKVSSVEAVVRDLSTVESAPVIGGGDVIGIRMLGEPTRLLQRDDVILGIDAHRITSSRQLADLAPHLHGKVTIAVRREGVEAMLELGE